jgi:hypothetical protein
MPGRAEEVGVSVVSSYLQYTVYYVKKFAALAHLLLYLLLSFYARVNNRYIPSCYLLGRWYPFSFSVSATILKNREPAYDYVGMER